MKKNLFILMFFFLLGLMLRTILLSSRPLGFTWDEAALGYNAFSLLKTGRDEYGQPFPVILKSFGDYKPGLYAYLTVPSVAFLGLTETATRLPSAIAGSLLIIVIYFLSRSFFTSRQALVISGLAAINPWLIHFSRGAWEVNIFLCLLALGSLKFIKARYIQSALFFGLTIITYQGAKLFTPLIILSLIFIFRPKPKLATSLLSGLLFVTVSLPVITGFFVQSGRLQVLSVFNYTRSQSAVNEIASQDQVYSNAPIMQLYHSEILDQARGILQRYLNHFSPQFLFFSGDWSNLRHSIPYQGYFYYPEIITLLTGLYLLLKFPSKGSKFIIAWLLLAPLPAAFSRDIVSGVRAFPLSLPVTIISGIGLAHFITRPIKLSLLLAGFAISLVYFLDLFFIHAPHYTALDWIYPYKPALNLIQPHLVEYDHVIFSSIYGQPYIYMLFYYQIDPKLYQQSALLSQNQGMDVGEVKSFGKFTFERFYWPAVRNNRSTIFVGDQFELPEVDLNHPDLVRFGDITTPDGTPTLRIVAMPK